MNSSTGLPALTSIITRRGFLSLDDHFLDGMGAEHLGALGFLGEEVVHLGDGAVVGHDGEAVVVHVEDEVLAHDGQADECDVALRFHSIRCQMKLSGHDTRAARPRQQNFWGANQPVCRAFSILVFRRQFRRVLTGSQRFV